MKQSIKFNLFREIMYVRHYSIKMQPLTYGVRIQVDYAGNKLTKLPTFVWTTKGSDEQHINEALEKLIEIIDAQ